MISLRELLFLAPLVPPCLGRPAPPGVYADFGKISFNKPVAGVWDHNEHMGPDINDVVPVVFHHTPNCGIGGDGNGGKTLGYSLGEIEKLFEEKGDDFKPLLDIPRPSEDFGMDYYPSVFVRHQYFVGLPLNQFNVPKRDWKYTIRFEDVLQDGPGLEDHRDFARLGVPGAVKKFLHDGFCFNADFEGKQWLRTTFGPQDVRETTFNRYVVTEGPLGFRTCTPRSDDGLSGAWLIDVPKTPGGPNVGSPPIPFPEGSM